MGLGVGWVMLKLKLNASGREYMQEKVLTKMPKEIERNRERNMELKSRKE
jgi:hypothetical protein